jgi:hypothetical protein
LKRGIAFSALLALTTGLTLGLPGYPAGASGRAAASIAVHRSTARLFGSVTVRDLARPAISARGPRTIPLLAPAPAGGPGARPVGGAVAQATVVAPTVTLGTVLSGPLASSDNPFALTPPDMGLAVGGGKVVQMVNVVGRIWNGTTAGSVFGLDGFFGTGTDFISDPWILFDTGSGRFFAGIFDVTLGGEAIAVSQTSNPSGAWNVYQIQYPGVQGGGCPDQGKGGVDDNVVGLGFNEFSSCTKGGIFLGAGFEVFNKAEMMAGAAVHFTFTSPQPQYFSMVPAHSLSATTTELFAGVDIGTGSKVHQVASTGVPGVSTVHLTALGDVTVPAYAIPPPAKQPGTAVKVDSGDDRAQHVVWRSGTLALTLTDRCVPAGDARARACARVISIGTGTNTLIYSTDLAKKGNYYIYPALSINAQGQAVVTFGDSSSKVFPSLLATAGTPAGAFASPIVVKAGTKDNTTRRYGDYFAVAIDPAAPSNAWVAGEVGGPLTGSFGWNTAVGQVLVS